MDLDEWERLLIQCDYPLKEEILKSLKEGVTLKGKDGQPLTSPQGAMVRTCDNLKSASELSSQVKIMEDMRKETTLGRRAGPFTAPPFPNLVCSPIGAVNKKHSTKLRVIHHLSWPRDGSGTSINEQLSDELCEYTLFKTVRDHIAQRGRGVLMAKFDISDAFRLVRLHPRHHSLLGMCFLGLYFYERCLPFGLKPAPAIFEMFATAINAFLTHEQIQVVFHYMDDFLLVCSAEEADKFYASTIAMFERLRIPLSKEKLSPPSTQIEFLGISIDTVSMTMSIPEDKLTRYRRVIGDWKDKKKGTRKELAELVGILVYSAYIIHHGNSFYHYLIGHLRDSRDCKPRAIIYLSGNALAELEWWHHFILAWNGTNLFEPSIDQFLPCARHTLHTDACNTGMGAWYDGHQYLVHAWDAAELGGAKRTLKLSMPYLELLSIVHSVNVWREELAGTAITINSDCLPAVKVINRGYSRHPGLMGLVRVLIFITTQHHIFVRCQHIAGVDNVEADILSRSAIDTTDPLTNNASHSPLEQFFSLPSVQNGQKDGKILLRKHIQSLPLPSWTS